MVKSCLVFAAGLGTRLGEMTKYVPKALVPVGDKPLLYHLLKKLHNQGFEKVVVNVHHLADQVKAFISLCDFPGMKIYVSDETKLLRDTGGALRYAKNFFEDDEHILLHNVDIISSIDLQMLCFYHMVSNSIATLAIQKRQSKRQFLFDKNLHLKGWKNYERNEEIILSDEPLEEFAFSGIHVVSREIFSLLPDDEVFSITKLYIAMATEQIIQGYVHNTDEWIDVGKPDSLPEANRIITLI